MVGDAGTILRTDDGGGAWALQALPGAAAVNLRDVAVIDHQRVIVVGVGTEPRVSSDFVFYHPGFIFLTRDGGATWVRPDSVPAELRGLYAVDMADADNGLAAGGDEVVFSWCYHPGAALLRTKDGGKTWAQEAAPEVERHPWTDVGLHDPSRAVVLGYAGAPFYTQDGTTWGEGSRDSCRLFDPSAVAFLDADAVVQVGNGMTAGVMKSDDGGRQWRSVGDPTFPSLLGLSFSGPTRGVAVGRYSTVILTEDAGETWRLSETFDPVLSGADVMAVHFPAAQVGYAVTWNGWIARTTDAGASWRIDRYVDCSLQAVRFLDPQTGFVGGSMLLRTTDGGATLTELRSSDGGSTYSGPPYPSCSSQLDCGSLDFADAATGVLVGGEGIYRTTDGGLTWRRVAPSFETADLSLRGVRFSGPTQVIAVATRVDRGGTVLRSTDAGETWQRADLPESAASGPHAAGLQAVHFPGGQSAVGYAVGSTGTVLRTDDGGQTWRNLRTVLGFGDECNGHWAGVFFLNPESGWIVGSAPGQPGDQAVILYTADGGAHWERQETPSPESFEGRRLRDVWFVSPTVGTAVGSDGLVVWTGSAGG